MYLMADKKPMSKREITLVGKIEGDDKCGACVEADNYISEKVKNNNKISYTKKQIDDDIASKEKIESIPFIRDCKIYEDGKKKCREIEGYEESDWADLDKLD